MNVRLAAALAANKRLAVLQGRRPLSMCGLEELCFSAPTKDLLAPKYKLAGDAMPAKRVK
jgi:hypothetical protein